MKVIFLGTNGWYDTETGNTPCVLIQGNDFHVVLDAGNGIHKLDKYIKDDKPIYLFLSHLHLDHIEGFHIFDKFNFKQGVKIFVREGGKAILNSFVNRPFTAPFADARTPSEIIEINEEKNNMYFDCEALQMQHSDGTLGYRLNIDEKIVSYSGDTAVCENSKQLAKDADLLIHECSWTEDIDSNWGHARPKQIATLAKETGVKKLALTHFDAAIYTNLELRKQAEEIAKSIFQNTIAATDGLELTI